MRELVTSLLGMLGGLVTLVLVAVFIGAVCGLGMWACSAVVEVMP